MEDKDRLRVLSQALWIQKNFNSVSKDKLFELINELDEFGQFSIRHLAAIAGNRISSSTLQRYLPQRARQGGKFNSESLGDILQVFWRIESGVYDYRFIHRIIKNGNSQNVIARLTGISQSLISRNINK